MSRTVLRVSLVSARRERNENTDAKPRINPREGPPLQGKIIPYSFFFSSTNLLAGVCCPLCFLCACVWPSQLDAWGFTRIDNSSLCASAPNTKHFNAQKNTLCSRFFASLMLSQANTALIK